jgi:hypothetical protein
VLEESVVSHWDFVSFSPSFSVSCLVCPTWVSPRCLADRVGECGCIVLLLLVLSPQWLDHKEIGESLVFVFFVC